MIRRGSCYSKLEIREVCVIFRWGEGGGGNVFEIARITSGEVSTICQKIYTGLKALFVRSSR